jgi:FixJ family two-component response regulator
MKQMTSEMKQQQLDWRRSQVLELASLGYRHREITRQLQIDKSAVKRHSAKANQFRTLSNDFKYFSCNGYGTIPVHSTLVTVPRV